MNTKKLFERMFAYVFMASLLIGVCSCGDDDEVGGLEELLGVWEITEATYSDGTKEVADEMGSDIIRIGFLENNVLVYYEKAGSNWAEEFRGTYTYNDGKLKLMANGSELELVGDHLSSSVTDHSITVLQLNESTLKVKEEGKEDGEYDYINFVFKRVE